MELQAVVVAVVCEHLAVEFCPFDYWCVWCRRPLYYDLETQMWLEREDDRLQSV